MNIKKHSLMAPTYNFKKGGVLIRAIVTDSLPLTKVVYHVLHGSFMNNSVAHSLFTYQAMVRFHLLHLQFVFSQMLKGQAKVFVYAVFSNFT